ncbi:hypothetical protein CKA32_000477 [Geitlerinema sp. FC II]|nr:hypothetical protein CKA32_000477 [Geitlerinema sp. FC II]
MCDRISKLKKYDSIFIFVDRVTFTADRIARSPIFESLKKR